MSLAGCVVVVTGASSGIGKATALRFAAEGAHVVVAARRRAALEQTAEECRRRGTRALVVEVDTSDAGAVERLAERAISEFGHFDVWVNNASALVFGSIEQTPLRAYRRVIDVNLLGYVHGAHAALQHFRRRGRGVLVNNASLASLMPTGYTNAYTTAKQAVAAFTNALRQELVPAENIHAVTIMPAGVDTPILEHAANYTGRRIRPLYPLVAPERVAAAIVECARRPRRTVVVGRFGRANAVLYEWAPGLAERIYGRAAWRALQRATPREPTDGNLFHAVPEGTGIDGGLRARSRGTRVLLPAVAALGIALAARAGRHALRGD